MARTTASTTPDSSDYLRVGSRPVFLCSYIGCETPVPQTGLPLCDQHARKMGLEERMRVDHDRHEAQEIWPVSHAHIDARFSPHVIPHVEPPPPVSNYLGDKAQSRRDAPGKATPKKMLTSGTKRVARKTTSRSTSHAGQQQKASTTNQSRQPGSPKSAPISSRKAVIHSPPDSPSRSGTPVKKKPKLHTNGIGHSNHDDIHHESFIFSEGIGRSPKPASVETGPIKENGLVNGFNAQPFDPSPSPYEAAVNHADSWEASPSWPDGVPKSFEMRESVTGSLSESISKPSSVTTEQLMHGRSSAHEMAQRGGQKSSPKTQGSKQIHVRPSQHIADITNWWSEMFDRSSESLHGSLAQSVQEEGLREGAVADSSSAYSVSTSMAETLAGNPEREQAKRRTSKASAPKKAGPGRGKSKRSKAEPRRQLLPPRKDSARKVRAHDNTPAITKPPPLEEERLRLVATHNQSAMDTLIYTQEGASIPPRGVIVPLGLDRPQPRDAPFYAHIDPRIHWPRPRSQAWHEAKQLEIKARGGRKANFGRSAERMADHRKKEGKTVLEDRIPQQSTNDLAWIQAAAWFEEVDKRQWEKDKEVTRQLEIQEQLERDASSRLESRGRRL